MADENRKVVRVDCNISCSAPNTPITKQSKSFLQKTPIPIVSSPKWKSGLRSPINNESVTPNQEAISLPVFATGHVRMVRDVVQHLPINENGPSIGDTLQHLESTSPSPATKKKVDGSAKHNKKPIAAGKEPKTKAKLLAKKH